MGEFTRQRYIEATDRVGEAAQRIRDKLDSTKLIDRAFVDEIKELEDGLKEAVRDLEDLRRTVRGET